MTDVNDTTQVLVAFARLEGKVDLALTEITGLKASDADHEARLRHIEAQPTPDSVTEKRLRYLEDKNTVTPAQLWAAVIGVSALVATILTIVTNFRSLFGA